MKLIYKTFRVITQSVNTIIDIKNGKCTVRTSVLPVSFYYYTFYGLNIFVLGITIKDMYNVILVVIDLLPVRRYTQIFGMECDS